MSRAGFRRWLMERARRFESSKKLVEQAKRVAEIISTGAVEKDRNQMERIRVAAMPLTKELFCKFH